MIDCFVWFVDLRSDRELQRGDEIAWYPDGDKVVRCEYSPATAYAFGNVLCSWTENFEIFRFDSLSACLIQVMSFLWINPNTTLRMDELFVSLCIPLIALCHFVRKATQFVAIKSLEIGECYIIIRLIWIDFECRKSRPNA